MSGSSQILRAKVKALLREGRGAEAIREYRAATSCDLATARRAIEALVSEPDMSADGSAEPELAQPPSPFPPATDAPSRAEKSLPHVLRWQPVEAPVPPPPLRRPHAEGFVAPPPRPTFGTAAAPRKRSDATQAPASSDLAVVFALALLLCSVLGGGLVVALLLGR